MYAGAAYVIIELTNNISDPLGLPAWTPTIVILLLAIGFPIVAILSWIFDLTPDGVKKTESIDTSLEQELPLEPGRRKLRAGDIIIAVLIVVVGILVYPKVFNRDKFGDARDAEGKVSIAVMPFENLSGDTMYNVWQGGFQNLLITTLSNSKELSVRQYQAVNKVLADKKNVNIASLTPSFASELAQKLETKTLILGNILKAGNKVRVNAQLVDAESEEIYKTYQVSGDTEDDIFAMADSLAGLIKNYIEIKKYTDQYNSPNLRGISFTNSSEAFKYYIHGFDAYMELEMETAVEWFSKAIETDSTFINPYVYISFAYQLMGNNRQSKYWCKKAYSKRDGLTVEGKLFINAVNAYYFETPYEEIRYLKQLIELDDLNPQYWHQLGFAHYKLFEYEDAINNWKQVFEIYEKWGAENRNPFIYFLLGTAYHKTNDHKKEAEVLELGRSLFPEAMLIIHYQAICAFSQGEIEKGNNLLSDYKSLRRNILHCTEAMISSDIGAIYSSANLFDEAENYYRNAIQIEPENIFWLNNFAWFLIDNEINVNEGLDLLEIILKLYPEYWPSLDSKGWGLYKLGRIEEALKLLKDSWDLRPAYVHEGYLHIQEVEQALAKKNSVSSDV